jgi:glycosyltransferase involved in cell wall biosynthesis
MNILLADFHKYIGYSGGIEHVLSRMAAALTARGHHVSCAFWDEKEGEPFFPLPSSVSVYNLCHMPGMPAVHPGAGLKLMREIVRPFSKAEARNINYRMLCQGRKQVERLLDLTKPDVIISSREPTGRLLLDGIGTDIPVISMLHNDPDEIFAHSPAEEKKALQKSAYIQALLPSFVEKAKKYLDYDRFIAIPNVVEPSSVLANPGADKERHVITNVGRVTGRTKRQHLLIEAFALLASDFPDWDVHIWGALYDKAYVMKLKQLIRGKGLENRVFLKGTTDAMGDVWKNTDIFAFPSHHEGFPLALTEAMAAGIPAVGYASCPAVNELIVDGKSGYLASDGVEDFSRVLRKLMEDGKLRDRMGNEARREMEAYSPDVVWNAWDELIQKAAENKTSDTRM